MELQCTSDFALIHEVFPIELLGKIFGNLGYKSLLSATRTCTYWKEIIDKLKLVKKASCT